MKQEHLDKWVGADDNLRVCIFDQGFLYNTETHEIITGIPYDDYCKLDESSCKLYGSFVTEDTITEALKERWFNSIVFFDGYPGEWRDEKTWWTLPIQERIYDLLCEFGPDRLIGENWQRKIYTYKEIMKLLKDIENAKTKK